jgi:hypothetical protein
MNATRTASALHKAAFAGLTFSLVAPSLAVFKKPGPVWLLCYLVLAPVLLWVLIERVAPRARRLGERTATVLTILLLTSVAVAVLVIHPAIDTQGFRIAGVTVGASDNDDAIDVGIQRLLAGENPYGGRTFLGQPIAPLAGAFLMALPFYALGNSAAQNVFWLAVFWLLARRQTRSGGAALVLLVSVLAVSPVVPYQLLQGQDYTTDAVAVAASSALCLWLARRAAPTWQLTLAGVATGVTMATRANFLLLLIPLSAALWRAGGWRAMTSTAGATAAFVGLSLPFYLWEPSQFAPLATSRKAMIVGMGAIGRTLIPLVGLAAAVAAAAAGRRRLRGEAGFYAAAFIVQATVVCLGFAVSSLQLRGADWFYLHYGVMFLFFGCLTFAAPAMGIARVDGDQPPESR